IDIEQCSGVSFSLTGSAEPGTGTGPFQYQWTPTTALTTPTNTSTVNGSLINPGPTSVVQEYFVTVIDSKGCSSIDSMEVTINPLPDVEAGPDSTLCNQPIVYPLGGYSPTVGGTGVWSGSPNLSGDEFTPNGLGVVNLTYTFTDDNGCINSDQVSLTVVAPVFPNAGSDLEFCSYDADQTLPATTIPGGIWSGTGVVQTTTGYDFSPTLSGAGSFILVYTVFDGTTCETTDTIQIIVHPPPIVDAGDDVSVCISDACINLTGFSPSTPSGQLLPSAYFYGEGGVSASGQFCPAANAPGDYIIGFHYTDPNTGCFNTDELIISNHPLPVAEFVVDDVFCTNTDEIIQNLSENDSIYGGVPSYSWNVLDVNGDTVLNSSQESFTLSLPDTGNYTVHLKVETALGGVAAAADSIYLIETPYPSFTLSDDTACAPVQITINNASEGNEVAYSWLVANASVSPPDTVYYSTSSAPSAINFPSPALGDTTFIVRLILGNECGSDTVVRPFIGRPTPVALPAVVNDTACSPFVPDFQNLSYGTPTSYFWDFGNGNTSAEFDPEGQVFMAIDNDTTTYEILLVATNECGKDSAIVTIVVLPNTVTAFFNTDPPFGCANLAVDFINVSSGADQFFWDFGDGTSPVTSYNANHVFEIGGVYTVEMIASDGCSFDTAYSTVNVLPKPDVSFIPVQDVICQGSVAEFINTSQGAVAYLWNFGDNEQIAAFEPPHVYVEPGIYPVRLIGYSPVYGCPDTVFQNITVQAIPDLSVFPNPSMGCMPLSVTLINNSTNVTSYEWDFGNGETSNSPVPGVEYLQPGDYDVNLIAHNYNFANNLDCPIDTQLTITVFETPVSSFSLDINTSCGDTARVGVSNASQGADSYLWKWEDNQSFLFEPSIFLSDTGLIPIDLVCSNVFGCRDTTTELYDLIGQPDARMRIRPPVGCEPLDVKFNSLSEYGDSWMWNFGDGTLNSEEQNPEHTYETAGLYSVSLAVSNEGKCFADTLIEFAVEVKRRAIAGLEFEPDNISLGDPVINLTNTSSFASSFVLDMGDGAIYNDFINQHIYTVDENDESILLTFVANNSNDCPDTLYKSIEVIPSSGIFVANSFTPDGDGINDFWAPVIDGKVNFYTLLVFNRWGEQIFATNDRNKQWDGWYQDRPVQIDVYVYHLIVSFEKEDKKMRRIGRVSVIR
ncbi:MAG: PKD domain-containing protein, partial [Bacteroidia bacterium]